MPITPFYHTLEIEILIKRVDTIFNWTEPNGNICNVMMMHMILLDNGDHEMSGLKTVNKNYSSTGNGDSDDMLLVLHIDCNGCVKIPFRMTVTIPTTGEVKISAISKSYHVDVLDFGMMKAFYPFHHVMYHHQNHNSTNNKWRSIHAIKALYNSTRETCLLANNCSESQFIFPNNNNNNNNNKKINNKPKNNRCCYMYDEICNIDNISNTTLSSLCPFHVDLCANFALSRFIYDLQHVIDII
jgi:hypothetical protein